MKSVQRWIIGGQTFGDMMMGSERECSTIVGHQEIFSGKFSDISFDKVNGSRKIFTSLPDFYYASLSLFV